MLPTMFRSMLPAFALSIMLFTGCTKSPTAIHPGAVNQFDSQTYDALITLGAAIEQAEVDVVKFPKFATALNSVIDVYNVALRSYKTYHQAAVSGQLPNVADLIQQIQTAQTAFAAIMSQIRPITEVRPRAPDVVEAARALEPIRRVDVSFVGQAWMSQWHFEEGRGPLWAAR